MVELNGYRDPVITFHDWLPGSLCLSEFLWIHPLREPQPLFAELPSRTWAHERRKRCWTHKLPPHFSTRRLTIRKLWWAISTFLKPQHGQQSPPSWETAASLFTTKIKATRPNLSHIPTCMPTITRLHPCCPSSVPPRRETGPLLSLCTPLWPAFCIPFSLTSMESLFFWLLFFFKNCSRIKIVPV